MVEGIVDDKGRVLIPREARVELRIMPRDRVEFEIKNVRRRESFMKNCVGVLKSREDVISLLHKGSPFR